ncbi:MAG TPA: glycosyl transferase [Pseudorhodoplanes sp.]|nr:glycosyl transferase [Pseudorhodoplanes sp.]
MNIAISLPVVAAALGAAAVLSFAFVCALMPLLRRFALSRPNARSSHRAPTPQGGGIAVAGATILVTLASAVAGGSANLVPLGAVCAAAAFLAVLGALDDTGPLPPLPRLAGHTFAAALALTAVPEPLIPALPYWIDRVALLLALVWVVNLTNFMDGIDWMTVAEIVPVTAALLLLGWLGALPGGAIALSAALLGGMLGFAPWNRPVARLFLGDAGSLPIGLILGTLLIALAGRGHWAAALLLPLYYLCDATGTLLRRLARGERPWQAHRDHFYQRALDGGMPIGGILARVIATNLALAALAVTVAWHRSPPVNAAALAAGALLVVLLLRRLARGSH